MAHAIIEYSANMEAKIDLDGLIDCIHAACIETGVFPLSGMRTRAARRDYFKLADGNPDAGFFHLVLKIGPGREEEVKLNAMNHIFDAFHDFIKPVFETSPMLTSIEVFELPPELRINKNHIKEYLEPEATAAE